MRNTELNDIRKAMGTLPNQSLEIQSTVYKGVEGISVEMIDNGIDYNPYKLIFENAVATWGNEEYKTKWPDVSPENRFRVVLAALTDQTLPLSLESVVFSFIVRGASRSSFDQHARQRFATFYSQGVRDNCRLDAGFRIPSELWDDDKLIRQLANHFKCAKELYKVIIERGEGSYQSARCILPMGMTHQYKFSVNLLALKSYMSQRLKACEQEDTVAVAIAVRDEIDKRYPLIASVLRPGCDYTKKCQYHKAYTLSEMFGCLFSGCGRWKDESPYSTFNKSCSNYETIREELGFTLPSPSDIITPTEYEDLSIIDKMMFDD